MTEKLLSLLKKSPIENAWAIQDLTVWPTRTKAFWSESPRGLSYLIHSGHPANDRHPMVIVDNQGGELETLLEHLPSEPFVIRESKADCWPVLKSRLPNATIYMEYGMHTDREKFRPVPSPKVRRLRLEDAPLMTEFFGAPPQAAAGFIGWIQGTVILAVVEEGKIQSLGTRIVGTTDCWELAAVETRIEARGKGYAQQVVSALTAMGLEQVPFVTLTVMQDNAAALAVYTKLGFEKRDERIWVDCGAGSRPG